MLEKIIGILTLGISNSTQLIHLKCVNKLYSIATPEPLGWPFKKKLYYNTPDL